MSPSKVTASKVSRKTAKQPAKTGAAAARKPALFTAEERAAMKEYVREQRAAADKVEGESAVLEKIAAMREPDRSMARRVHAVVMANAPGLTPRLWYGMPAYAMDGKIVCFFQDAQKFKARYATLGFNDFAKLDAGRMWPVAFALKELTAAEEAQIAALVRKAVG
jgi:uncharacterized protein YdhG (YjbR/CyaY superfamily)